MFYSFLIIPAIYETVRILVSENSFWPQGLICCTCCTLPECAENEFSKMSAAIILDCITEAETGWDDCWLMRSQRSYLHISYGLNTMLMSHKWLGRPCLQEYMRIIMQRLALKGQLIFRLWSPAGGEENHKNSRNAIQVILFTLLKVQALGSLNSTLYFEYTTFLRYISLFQWTTGVLKIRGVISVDTGDCNLTWCLIVQYCASVGFLCNEFYSHSC